MSYLRFCLLPLVLLVFAAQTTAQPSGWDEIQKNNFVAARAVFEGEIRQNPKSESALTGLLFLAETVQDYENYQRYAHQLLTAEWAPHYVWLFGPMYTGQPTEALRQNLPESIRLPFILQQADTLFHHRRFGESAALANSALPRWNWAVTGPFANVGGSNFAETTPVETSPFNLGANFKNEYGVEFRWVKRTLVAPGKPVYFHNLPNAGRLATFYANTFLTVPTARRVALRITRSEPIKIWLDDQPLFARAHLTAATEWDAETVTFDLPAGTHRLLVKISEFPEEKNDSQVDLEYNDGSNSGDGTRDDDDNRNRQGFGHALNSTGFALRLTDPATGRLFTDVTTAYTASYAPAGQQWAAQVEEQPYLQFFKQKADEAPASRWQQYLLAKAFHKSKALETGEEYFSHQAAASPNSAFGKFLLAKFYAANNKGERAEALLSEMDTVTAPTFVEHAIRLNKINAEQEEGAYLTTLQGMLLLSPTNWPILNRYLRFLKEKGRKVQIKNYVRAFLEKHDSAKWKERLEEYLREDSYKPESYKPMTDKDRDKEFKKVQKRQQKIFGWSEHDATLVYYKRKERVSDVLKTYDEGLAIMPYATSMRFQKANYLFEKERADEALAILQPMLEDEPYDDDIYELIGDIFIEKKNESEALKWYRQADKIRGASDYSSVADKIEKLENKKKYTGYFSPVNLHAAVKDRSWEAQYKDEEAVIALYSQQFTYLPDVHKLQSVNKIVVHIRNEAGAKMWTEADLRLLGQITSAKVLKKDGSSTSPDLSDYGVAVFKNLHAGDVIVVEGAADRNMPNEIPGEFLNISITSWPAPVAQATVELLTPKAQELFFACNRVTCAHTTRDTGDWKLLHWDWHDIPKTQTEEAAPDNLDTYAWLMMGSSPNWSRVVQWYNRKTYCRTEPNYEVLDQARALLRPDMKEDQVVQTLHNFITQDINYSFVPFLNTNYVPKKPGATLSGKVGDCKDVATLMITLLREQGIPAWYTLVSTHTFSNQEPRPTLYIFNHAIVAYQSKDGQLHFADLTTDYFPNDVLPAGDSDAWGLVIREGETQLRRLPNDAMDPKVTRVDITAQATVDADGNISLDAQTVRHGVAGGNWREGLLRATEEDRRKKISEYFGGGVLNHLDLGAIEFANLDSINEPLQTRVQMTAYNQLDKVSDLYIMPLPLPLSTPTQKAMFAAKRYNDLDVDNLFELAPVRETVDLALPAGYRLAGMPQNQRISNAFGDYALTFEKTATGLRIRREVTLKQRFVHHADFQAFKKFYLDMLDADDALLALRK